MSKNLFVSQVCSMPHHMPGRNVAAKMMVSEEMPDRLFVTLTIEGNKSEPVEIPLSDIRCLSMLNEDGVYLYAGGLGEFSFVFRKAEWARAAEEQLRRLLTEKGLSPAASLDDYMAALDDAGRAAFEAQCRENDINRQKALAEDSAMRRRSSLRSAIWGYVLTVGVAIYGIVVYSQGNYLEWLGIPFDSFWKFLLLIAAFLAADTWALLRGLKNK